MDETLDNGASAGRLCNVQRSEVLAWGHPESVKRSPCHPWLWLLRSVVPTPRKINAIQLLQITPVSWPIYDICIPRNRYQPPQRKLPTAGPEDDNDMLPLEVYETLSEDGKRIAGHLRGWDQGDWQPSVHNQSGVVCGICVIDCV